MNRLRTVAGQLMAAEYEAGHSIRRIAADWNVSYGTVHLRLSEVGCRMRPVGGRRAEDPQ